MLHLPITRSPACSQAGPGRTGSSEWTHRTRSFPGREVPSGSHPRGGVCLGRPSWTSAARWGDAASLARWPKELGYHRAPKQGRRAARKRHLPEERRAAVEAFQKSERSLADFAKPARGAGGGMRSKRRGAITRSSGCRGSPRFCGSHGGTHCQRGLRGARDAAGVLGSQLSEGRCDCRRNVCARLSGDLAVSIAGSNGPHSLWPRHSAGPAVGRAGISGLAHRLRGSASLAPAMLPRCAALEVREFRSLAR